MPLPRTYPEFAPEPTAQPIRIHDTAEFQQHTVAGRLDDTPVMFRDCGVDEFAAVRLESRGSRSHPDPSSGYSQPHPKPELQQADVP
jgi:hypothetical protein